MPPQLKGSSCWSDKIGYTLNSGLEGLHCASHSVVQSQSAASFFAANPPLTNDQEITVVFHTHINTHTFVDLSLTLVTTFLYST